ncbi:MAG: efflux RND transporter periplasmic adaptor subunit [Anaerolineales bacterium]|nr:efflux RND transporter periplasmic adaptor subunit [Anaerolineales bacterium]
MKALKLFIPILLALSIVACGTAPATAEATPIPTVIADDTIISEGRLEPLRYTELALNANGLISEVLKSEGETVAPGDVIARLESSEAQTLEAAQATAADELTAAYQDVRDAQFKLDNFDVPASYANLTPSEAVKAELAGLNKARADFEPYKNAATDSARNYKKALDNAWAKYRKAIQWLELESALQDANSRLILAQRNYDSLQDPSFAEGTAGARAALANAEIRAPFAGTLTNLDLKVGEFRSAGQPVATIADTSSWIVKTTDLTEIDVVKVKEGQPVTVSLDTFPNKKFKGHVLTISQNYAENQGDVVYEVVILLTDQDAAMRWGMTAVVTFE